MFVSSPVKIRSIAIRFDGSDRWHKAVSVTDLAELLLSRRWSRSSDDAMWRKALVACLASQRSEAKAGKARKAFIKAALRAALIVKADTRVH